MASRKCTLADDTHVIPKKLQKYMSDEDDGNATSSSSPKLDVPLPLNEEIKIPEVCLICK